MFENGWPSAVRPVPINDKRFLSVQHLQITSPICSVVELVFDTFHCVDAMGRRRHPALLAAASPVPGLQTAGLLTSLFVAALILPSFFVTTGRIAYAGCYGNVYSEQIVGRCQSNLMFCLFLLPFVIHVFVWSRQSTQSIASNASRSTERIPPARTRSTITSPAIY